MDAKILNQCEELAFQNKISFPEAVKRLAQTGVERYCADLVRLEKFYYSAKGETLTVAMPLQNAPNIGGPFLTDKVRDAVKTIQQGKIDYPEFLRCIMKAGTVYYDVFTGGRRVIYTGRQGDFHVEHFPKISAGSGRIQVSYDPERNIVVLEFMGKIEEPQAKQLLVDIQKAVPAGRKGFSVLTDLSGVESVDHAISPWVKEMMDFLNKQGVAKIARVIPDPAQDIGLNIMSLFHYSKTVEFFAVQTREEAEARLAQ